MLYCDEHGDALCERCQDPALALPSYRIYRGSLLALLGGTIFAVWLLVRPPLTVDGDSPGVPPALSGVISASTATVKPTVTVTPTPVPTATSTPASSATPEPTAGPARPTFREHTVAEGDTMFSIAFQYLPANKNVLVFVEEIAALNELSDVNAISIGSVLKVPLQ
jgi:LysM repeat protein